MISPVSRQLAFSESADTYAECRVCGIRIKQTDRTACDDCERYRPEMRIAAEHLVPLMEIRTMLPITPHRLRQALTKPHSAMALERYGQRLFCEAQSLDGYRTGVLSVAAKLDRLALEAVKQRRERFEEARLVWNVSAGQNVPANVPATASTAP